MRELSELNFIEAGAPVKRPAPTARMIEAFEKRFGHELPKEYVAVLHHSNGGHPELDLFLPIGRAEAAPWGVNRFYALDDDRTSTSSLWAAVETWQPVLGKDALPFAADGGGNQFFLDFRSIPPAVRGCVHDEGFRVVDLAPSFEAFIDGLQLDPDMI